MEKVKEEINKIEGLQVKSGRKKWSKNHLSVTYLYCKISVL
jgi:hypothetical protein